MDIITLNDIDAIEEYQRDWQYDEMKEVKGPALLEIQVKKGFRKDLGRPTINPKENKKSFMKFLEK